MEQYKPGDTAYVLVSNSRVEEVTVIQRRGDRYSLQSDFVEGMFLPASRLFRTEDEARLSVRRMPAENAHLVPRPIRTGRRHYEGNMYYDEE